jgi:hypothetical protein
MNRVERRVRNVLNPYSTSFARWWRQSGRHTWLGGMIAAASGRMSRTERPGPVDEMPGDHALHVPTRSMAARRDAIDAAIAKTAGGQGESGAHS